MRLLKNMFMSEIWDKNKVVCGKGWNSMQRSNWGRGAGLLSVQDNGDAEQEESKRWRSVDKLREL